MTNQTCTPEGGSSLIFSENAYKIYEAIRAIQDGHSKRVDIPGGIKVYQCATIVRIDIKSNG